MAFAVFSAIAPMLLISAMLLPLSAHAAYSVQMVNGGYTLSWQVNSSLIITMSAQTTGWVGFGFGDQMVGSNAVIGWVDDSGQATVQAYALKGTSESRIVAGSTPAFTLLSATETSGTTTISFAMAMPTTNGSQAVIVAYGGVDYIQNHGSNYDQGTIDLSVGTGTSSGADLTVQRIQWHAALMTIGYAFLMPIGMLIGRYFPRTTPNWFLLHRTCQLVAVLLVIAAFILIVVVVDKTGAQHFQGDGASHKIVGLVVMIMVVLQVIVGVIRPHPGPSPVRMMWLWVHRCLGLSTWILGLAAIALGFVYGDGAVTSAQCQAAIGIIFAVQGIFVAAALVFERTKQMTQSANAPSYKVGQKSGRSATHPATAREAPIHPL